MHRGILSAAMVLGFSSAAAARADVYYIAQDAGDRLVIYNASSSARTPAGYAVKRLIVDARRPDPVSTTRLVSGTCSEATQSMTTPIAYVPGITGRTATSIPPERAIQDFACRARTVSLDAFEQAHALRIFHAATDKQATRYAIKFLVAGR